MKKTSLLLIVIIIMLMLSSLTSSADPDCTGVERWPASMAFGELKNAGLTDNSKLDFTKTKVIRLASEKIGKNSEFPEYGEVYRQIHHIVFTEKTGKKIEVITVNEASYAECSMSGVDVFVVSQYLGGK